LDEDENQKGCDFCHMLRAFPVKSWASDHQISSNSTRSNTLQLILGTGAFALCFAVFGSVSAMMPVLKKQFHLAPVQASIAMAIPVLLGSFGRIPLGLLADRIGGRKVFTWTMFFSVAAALLMGKVETYSQLLLFGFFTGKPDECFECKKKAGRPLAPGFSRGLGK
jgi:NNP family nitrate/nitrite transporter-like MFS transporter